MKKIKLFICCIVLLIVACTGRYLPVPAENIAISGDYAILRTGEVTLAAADIIWTHEPQFLANYCTTIHIRLQNTTREIINIDITDFALIDQNGQQYDIIPTELVLDLALKDPSLIPDSFAIPVDGQRENLARRNEIQRNITMRAFSFGDIQPNAFKEGILYFPKLDSKNTEFTLIFKSNEIKYRKTK